MATIILSSGETLKINSDFYNEAKALPLDIDEEVAVPIPEKYEKGLKLLTSYYPLTQYSDPTIIGIDNLVYMLNTASYLDMENTINILMDFIVRTFQNPSFVDDYVDYRKQLIDLFGTLPEGILIALVDNLVRYDKIIDATGKYISANLEGNILLTTYIRGGHYSRENNGTLKHIIDVVDDNRFEGPYPFKAEVNDMSTYTTAGFRKDSDEVLMYVGNAPVGLKDYLVNIDRPAEYFQHPDDEVEISLSLDAKRIAYLVFSQNPNESGLTVFMHEPVYVGKRIMKYKNTRLYIDNHSDVTPDSILNVLSPNMQYAVALTRNNELRISKIPQTTEEKQRLMRDGIPNAISYATEGFSTLLKDLTNTTDENKAINIPRLAFSPSEEYCAWYDTLVGEDRKTYIIIIRLNDAKIVAKGYIYGVIKSPQNVFSSIAIDDENIYYGYFAITERQIRYIKYNNTDRIDYKNSKILINELESTFGFVRLDTRYDKLIIGENVNTIVHHLSRYNDFIEYINNILN